MIRKAQVMLFLHKIFVTAISLVAGGLLAMGCTKIEAEEFDPAVDQDVGAGSVYVRDSGSGSDRDSATADVRGTESDSGGDSATATDSTM